MNLLGLPGDLIGLIFSPQYTGALGCTMASMVCKDLAVVVRGKTLKKSAACAEAARAGYINVLKWLHEYGCTLTADVCTAAAGAGHLDIVKWLREVDCPWNSCAQKFAARGGHLDVLEWFDENGGHLDVLEWFDENGCPRDRFTEDYAASGGHVHILEWMHVRGYNMYWLSLLCSATTHNQVKILEWAMAHQYGVGVLLNSASLLTRYAAESGHLDVIKWLHEKRIFVVKSCMIAVDCGHEHIVEWMIANGLYSD